MTHPEIAFDGYVLSLAKYQTPHDRALGLGREPTVNEDYGLYTSGVGLVVADGVGGAYAPQHSAAVSRLATEAVLQEARNGRISELPPDEAQSLVLSQILPRADRVVKEYKSQLNTSPEVTQRISTVIGGLLFGRDSTLIAFGAGDIHVLHYQQGKITPSNLVKEQVLFDKPNIVTNYLAGEGRQNPDSDQAAVVHVAPGDRLLVTSDGFHGDYYHQRIPEWVIGQEIPKHGTAEGLVARLSRLPLELAGQHPDAFLPKSDDMTIGALYVNLQVG